MRLRLFASFLSFHDTLRRSSPVLTYNLGTLRIAVNTRVRDESDNVGYILFGGYRTPTNAKRPRKHITIQSYLPRCSVF